MGTCHSPKLIHLILQSLCLLGQAGQRLVPLLQLGNLPLQIQTALPQLVPLISLLTQEVVPAGLMRGVEGRGEEKNSGIQGRRMQKGRLGSPGTEQRKLTNPQI